jgi:hypothetical protein
MTSHRTPTSQRGVLTQHCHGQDPAPGQNRPVAPGHPSLETAGIAAPEGSEDTACHTCFLPLVPEGTVGFEIRLPFYLTPPHFLEANLVAQDGDVATACLLSLGFCLLGGHWEDFRQFPAGTGIIHIGSKGLCSQTLLRLCFYHQPVQILLSTAILPYFFMLLTFQCCVKLDNTKKGTVPFHFMY